MSAIKPGFKNNICANRQEYNKVASNFLRGKPAFGKIFNIKAIAGIVLILVILVLGLMFFPRILESEKQLEESITEQPSGHN